MRAGAPLTSLPQSTSVSTDMFQGEIRRLAVLWWTVVSRQPPQCRSLSLGSAACRHALLPLSSQTLPEVALTPALQMCVYSLVAFLAFLGHVRWLEH